MFVEDKTITVTVFREKIGTKPRKSLSQSFTLPGDTKVDSDQLKELEKKVTDIFLALYGRGNVATDIKVR